jgi:hypothetical protein
VHDAPDVAGAEGAGRALHAAGAVVVGRDGERPGEGQLVVLAQQARRGHGGAMRIEPLVEHVVHVQEESPGRARELPEARRADARIGVRVERGLDVGQGGQLGGHAVGPHRLLDVVAPRTGADESFAVAVGLSQLEAHVQDRVAQRLVADAGRPARQHLGFVARESGALALGELAQSRLDARLRPLDALLATPVREALRYADHLVDYVEVLGVVDQPARDVDLGVDARPEADGGLEGARLGQGLFGPRRCGSEHQDGCEYCDAHGPGRNRQPPSETCAD